jgi:hypothetical protein
MNAMELKELADARDYVCAQLGLEAADAGEDEDDDEDEEEKEKKHTENEDDEEDEDEEADEERLRNLDAELAGSHAAQGKPEPGSMYEPTGCWTSRGADPVASGVRRLPPQRRYAARRAARARRGGEPRVVGVPTGI